MLHVVKHEGRETAPPKSVEEGKHQHPKGGGGEKDHGPKGGREQSVLLSTWIETCTSSDTPVHTKCINQELPSSATSADRH